MALAFAFPLRLLDAARFLPVPLPLLLAGKELKLRAAKFSKVNAITLFFDGEELERIGLSRVRVNGTPIQKADVSKIQKC